MDGTYVLNSPASLSGSDSNSSSAPPPRRDRRRQKHKQDRLAPQAVAPAPQAASNESPDDKKKKKKPTKPPQETIQQIWDKFSQKKFSKALAVLPSSPIAASTSADRGNELLSAGYERAAEECRRKIRRIISECRRINTRYRDPGWDLDWDFKWRKGHCLNSLGEPMFALCRSNLINPAARIPKAVKRVHEIFENPTFMGSLLPGDIKQGDLGNCWFVASLTGLANVPDGIKRICVEYDTKIGIYGFVFYRDGEWIYSIVDDKLYLKSPCWDSPSMQRDLLQQIDREDVERVYRKTYQTGSKALFFAQNKDQNETWVPLIEKAYAKAHGDFASLSGGWIGEALEDLSGGVTTELLASDIFDTEAFWENEISNVNQEFLFGCSTGLLDGGYGERDGIREGHAYVIMEARTLKNGTRLCKLRNPWGNVKKGNWEGAWSDGSKEWNTEVQEELNHTFGSDSTFWISYDDLLRKYQHFDRTRLFRHPDWRCCQRWLGVEVPWKPQYNEKLHIKLTKESPLVLVLSQLDTRYFRRLQGQYRFRLQFRLHEEGRPGAEEYIVRSHGNYLMYRSVSVELPTGSLSPGTYVVFISISGQRDARVFSTESVIKRECKAREENEKLAQIGQAYDLAHAKAASHLERLSKVRKIAESKKASESRKKERRKNWENRQVRREVDKKQKTKDDVKKAGEKAAKRAKAEAEAKAKAATDAAKQQEAVKAQAAEEERKKQSDDQPAHKEMQTEAKQFREGGSQTEADADNASTTSTSSSSIGTPQYTPQETPKSEPAQPVPSDKQVDVPPVEMKKASDVSGGPPPQSPQCPNCSGAILADVQKPLELKVHYCSCSTCKPPQKVDESDDYSSDSPVEDYELLYDEDDVTPTLPLAGAPATTPANGDDSDDEDLPDPWNAIAVIGFRVYSKDEDLELRVVMEGGELEQDGMGNLGEVDLDNAVSNAAGQREKKQEEEQQQQQQKKDGQIAQTGVEGAEQKQGQIPATLKVVTTADANGAGAETKGIGQEGEQKAPENGRASYRTIIERKTSEYDRVMGKIKVDNVDQDQDQEPSSGDLPVDTATTDGNTPTTEKQSVDEKPVDEKPVDVDMPAEPAEPASEKKVTPLAQPTSIPGSELDRKTKEVLQLRHKLQKGLLNRTQAPKQEDMPEMSNFLAKLEAYCDLEARIIRATKIHKVLEGILKLKRIPRDEEFSLWSRAEALLDDFELTLVTSEAGDDEHAM